MKIRITCLSIASIVEKSYLALKLTFDLEITKKSQTFKLALIGFELSTTNL